MYLTLDMAMLRCLVSFRLNLHLSGSIILTLLYSTRIFGNSSVKKRRNSVFPQRYTRVSLLARDNVLVVILNESIIRENTRISTGSYRGEIYIHL